MGVTTSAPETSERNLPDRVSELRTLDHIAEVERGRAEERADARGDDAAGDERQHVDDPLEAGVAMGEASQEGRGDDDGDGIPERLA